MSALEESKPVLMLPAALWWAGKGVPVFPLHNAVLTPMLEWACSCGDPCTKDSPAKHPRTAHGVNDATTDSKIVTAWWERWPEANIGLACGVKFDLLDIDGPDGFQVLKQIEAELGPVKAVSVVESGRKDGGRHYYVTPPGFGSLAGNRTSPKGIDVKSVGGYAVAPPSQHVTGYRYTMTTLYAEHDEPTNWEAVHARLRELAPKKPKTEATRKQAVPAEHRSDAWRKRARGWCVKALQGVAGTLGEMGENSGRNDYLNAQTWRMLRFADAGHLDAGEVLDTMRQAGLDSGLSHTETETTLRSAINGADRDGPLDPDIGEDTDYDPFAGLLDTGETEEQEDAPAAVEPVAEAATAGGEGSFWTSRPELEHIRTFARARRCSPWAVLGVVLARVVTATPQWVVLPPLVGSHASLNLFVALVGPSGGGKGAAESAAADCIDIRDTDGEHIDTATVGSGEGIGHLYAHREKGEIVRDRYAVLFTVPEVDNLSALGARQGATLMPQLRSAWSGERLGFSYADKNKALPIERHTYRMGLVLGVQPGRAASLLDDADGGTPQRFLWLPVSDPDAPDAAPPVPVPMSWRLTGTWTATDVFGAEAGGVKLVELPIPGEVREEVTRASLDRLRAQTDALDGHAMLARLKIAASLGLLAGRKHVTIEDWTLSGTLLEVSTKTRDGVVAYLSSKASQANRAKGEAESQRAVIVADRVAEEAVKRVARKVLSHCRRNPDGMVRSELRRVLAGRDRQHFDEAVERLNEAGQVSVEASERGERIKVRE